MRPISRFQTRRGVPSFKAEIEKLIAEIEAGRRRIGDAD
jgi:hypothetical protein